jgi:hypothetical protein
VQRALAAAERTGTQVLVPRPGERVDVLSAPPLVDWWSAVGSVSDRPSEPAGRADDDLTRRG